MALTLQDVADEWFEGDLEDARNFRNVLPYSKIPEPEDCHEVLAFLHGLDYGYGETP